MGRREKVRMLKGLREWEIERENETAGEVEEEKQLRSAVSDLGQQPILGCKNRWSGRLKKRGRKRRMNSESGRWFQDFRAEGGARRQ